MLLPILIAIVLIILLVLWIHRAPNFARCFVGVFCIAAAFFFIPITSNIYKGGSKSNWDLFIELCTQFTHLQLATFQNKTAELQLPHPQFQIDLVEKSCALIVDTHVKHVWRKGEFTWATHMDKQKPIVYYPTDIDSNTWKKLLPNVNNSFLKWLHMLRMCTVPLHEVIHVYQAKIWPNRKSINYTEWHASKGNFILMRRVFPESKIIENAVRKLLELLKPQIQQQHLVLIEQFILQPNENTEITSWIHGDTLEPLKNTYLKNAIALKYADEPFETFFNSK